MRVAATIGLLAAAWSMSCGSGGLSCPNDLPKACPSMVPSYQNDVLPAVTATCLNCHTPGGQEASMQFNTYDEIYASRSSILDQIYKCDMPPADSVTLTAAERATLLNWLVCGAPNN